ncbi:MAG: GIY-YIG nuclease family protein [bacterium]|nr:GIY-YIG nuclease family protein [bacterium]
MSIKDKIKKAPNEPGVYTFKNSRGGILYIGKAANLKSRLKSYTGRGWKEDMLRKAKSVSWEVLSSDVAALIREAELIKRNKPKYNFIMRDDKRYAYVAFTKNTFPRMYITHQPRESKNEIYIGPFTDVTALRRVLKLLRRAFPYCTCPPSPKHKRPCVNAQIGKCLGFCCSDVKNTKQNEKTYKANLHAIKKVLTGKSRSLLGTLEKRMVTLSKARKYESAALIRNQLGSLERIFAHSPHLKRDIAEEREKALESLKEICKLSHFPERIEGYDISHHQGASTVASMVVFENGMPAKDEYRKFNIKTVKGVDDFASMTEVLSRRLKHDEWAMPDLIIVDGGKGQLSAARKALGKKHIPLASLAKREEELYIDGRRDPIKLKQLPPPLLNLVTHLRDESHRFAITFHRKQRRRLVTER